MRRSDTTVAVLVDRGLGWANRVLVPFQGGVHDRGALELGIRLARHAGASVTVLQVADVDPTRPEGSGGLDTVLGGLLDQQFPDGGRIMTKMVDHAEPVHAVIEECEAGYDLVVIGASAAWGLEHRSFGLQPELIIRDCPASLLVVRHHEAAAATSVGAATPHVPEASARRA
jgi:nucleotide-binding universal stress UspA family protein